MFRAAVIESGDEPSDYTRSRCIRLVFSILCIIKVALTRQGTVTDPSLRVCSYESPFYQIGGHVAP